MNLQEMRDLIRTQAFLEEDDLEDDDIDQWINDAKNRVDTYQDWAYLNVNADLNVTANTNSVTLPDDFAFPIDVRYVSPSGLEHPVPQINPEERPLNLTTSGRIQYYWIDGNDLFVWRSPTQDTVVRVNYVSAGTELTAASDEPEFDSRFHRILVIGALVRVYEWLEYWEEARVLEGDFQRRLDAMDRFYNRFRQGLRFGQNASGMNPTAHPFPWEV